MIAVLLALALALQFGQRPPLAPAETLLESVVLRAFNDVEPAAAGAIDVITGWDQAAGEVVISCATGGCAAAAQVASKLETLIDQDQLPQPARTIRFLSTVAAPPGLSQRVKAALHLDMAPAGRALQIVRSPWSTASIVDEAVEVFALQPPYGSVAGAEATVVSRRSS